MEYYSAIKKSEMVPFAATWMDLEIIILSKVSQTEKYHIISSLPLENDTIYMPCGKNVYLRTK